MKTKLSFGTRRVIALAILWFLAVASFLGGVSFIVSANANDMLIHAFYGSVAWGFAVFCALVSLTYWFDTGANRG